MSTKYTVSRKNVQVRFWL